MKRPTAPITAFCRDVRHALELNAITPDSCALVSGPGTLKFHTLIAQHGAGEFKTLFVPQELRGKFKLPAGGTVKDLG